MPLLCLNLKHKGGIRCGQGHKLEEIINSTFLNVAFSDSGNYLSLHIRNISLAKAQDDQEYLKIQHNSTILVGWLTYKWIFKLVNTFTVD